MNEETVNRAMPKQEKRPASDTLCHMELEATRAMKRLRLDEEDPDCLQQGATKAPTEQNNLWLDSVVKTQQRNQEPLNIMKLNDDVMLHIFGYLDLPGRLQAELVCVRWLHLLKVFWRSVKEINFRGFRKRFAAAEAEKLFHVLLHHGSNRLRRLDVSELPIIPLANAVFCITNQCPGLTQMNLCGAMLTNLELTELAMGCKHLRWINLCGCEGVEETGLQWLFYYCKDLIYVDLSGNGKLGNNCFRHLTKNVRTLLLNNCSDLRDVDLEELSRIRELYRLEIEDCVRLSDTGIERLTSGCQMLQILRLTRNKQINSVGFSFLGRLHKLRELYLSENVGLDDDALASIGHGCSQLSLASLLAIDRVLDISDIYQETCMDFRPIAKLHCLEELDVAGSPGLTDSGLETIVHGCGRLRILNITNCNNLTSVGYSKIAGLRHLEELIVAGSSALSDEDLEAIGRWCGKLEVLSLEDCEKITSTRFTYVGRSHIWQELYLGHSLAANDNVMEALCHSSRHLKILDIEQCHNVTPVGLCFLGRLLALEELCLANNPQGVDDEVLKAIGRGCGQLRTLDIRGCGKGVTDVGIEALAKCTLLQELDVTRLDQLKGPGLIAVASNANLTKLMARDCGQISEFCIHTVVKMCYKLEELDVRGCMHLGRNTTLEHIIACRQRELGKRLSLDI